LGETDSSKLPRAYGDTGRTAVYHEGLAMAKALMQEEIRYKHGVFIRTTHHHAPVNASPFGLHYVMFIPTLKLQASPEQLAYWLPLAESGKIIGTYCQTEMGHGTFVRGLETTATFDQDADQFIIHSPTVSATKFWPGGLGYSCSHAIVMAQLIINGKHYGVHPFMVQLRSLEDFKPLPGIELGDIGPKMNYNSTDNGYAIFTNIRIPRHHMMMGYSKVLRDGTFLKAPHNKLTYSTMVYTRNIIIHTVGFQLAQAVTIAIRYSVVREQGHPSSGDANLQEVCIMSYKSQQYRLFSIISRAFAIVFASGACELIYQDLVTRQQAGDHSTLAYGHITTASLKAYATQVASDGAEDARKCCGGHGYSSLSGLPDIVTTLVPMATLEGENYVMYLQTARYLVKCASAIKIERQVDAPMSYLAAGLKRMQSPGSHRCSAAGSEFLLPGVQLAIFKHRAVRLTFECEELLRDCVQRGLSSEEAWNVHMMALIIAARAHIELFILVSFVDKVASIEDLSIRGVLNRLRVLFALVAIESPYSIGAIGFFEDGHISQAQLRDIRSLVHATLSQLVPDAVALTDAWGFTDASLQSALGRKDGDVYATLLSWARQLPLNLESAETGGVDLEGFQRYVSPILHSKL
jgi:acyl-CoA oxidase